MRFLVTGASGFIGARLASYLREGGHEVLGTIFGADPAPLPFPTRELDILDADAVSEVMAAADPEVVLHLAGRSHVGSSWQQVAEYFRINVLGTHNVLRGAAGRRVVLASSAEVYGLVPESEQPIAESRLLDPRNPYAMSKASAELLTRDAGGVVVRSFNLIGPGQSETFALPSFAKQLAAIERGDAEPVLKIGNLEARRDFLHVDDALEAYRLVATQGVAGECYNLGSGEAHSVRELLEVLLAVSGVEARAETDPERFRPVDVPENRADIGKLSALGWRPRRGVQQALRDLWESVRDGGAADRR